MQKCEELKPAMIVLGKNLTCLATVRGGAAGGVKVHATAFDSHSPIRLSSCCKTIQLSDIAEGGTNALLQWLLMYATNLGNRPVVIPTSDEYALFLAKHYEQLAPYCRMWTTSFEDLEQIVKKDSLYRLAHTVGIEVIPALYEPDLEEVEVWSEKNPGPYFLKPFYQGIAGCALRDKNLQLADRDQLLSYVDQHGSKALIIQLLIGGGDGHIFDAYGLCDAKGQIRTIASHRRWRQFKPDVGVTTYGEIPMSLSGDDEFAIFEKTERLLKATRFHGIFGIEWLQDKTTGQFYLIDFNARPFSSIGHLTACGLNLPLLAYRELIGENLSILEKRPKLDHKYWVDFFSDLRSFKQKGAFGMANWSDWLSSILRCRSFAYWDWRDPGPGLYRLLQIIALGMRFCGRRLPE